jgi:hypothetical protein
MWRMTSLATVASLSLTLAGASRADDQKEMRLVLDKAIKAAGGEEKLGKLAAQTFKVKGKFYGMGEGIDYTGDFAVQLPDKMRFEIAVEVNGMKFSFAQGIDGDKGWVKMQDKAEDAGKDALAELKEELHASQAESLLPLKENRFRLEPLGEVKVNGKPAVGVRASHKGRRDINLFFDKETWLLVKSERVVKDLMAGDQEFTHETFYSDYKDVNGTKQPTKLLINRDGKKDLDGEITDVEAKEKLDDATFAKP